ncbi:DNA-processing protein DprA [Frankia sp. Cj3]|uniref:DNA-processing protein DprA n=1 Tax=Frankia sp. Cj3 TaxID=2880976 RepID=UPI0035B0C9E2
MERRRRRRVRDRRTPTPTVAVLASVADRHTQRALLADVERYGVVVSQAPPDTAPAWLRFTARQRLIVGLVRGVVVVEAGLRSATLTAAHTAAAVGRPVMAVPGPITSATSAGCHLILRTHPDTRLVTTGHDVTDPLTPPDPATLPATALLGDGE